jgi:hypothetical protein
VSGRLAELSRSTGRAVWGWVRQITHFLVFRLDHTPKDSRKFWVGEGLENQGFAACVRRCTERTGKSEQGPDGWAIGGKMSKSTFAAG